MGSENSTENPDGDIENQKTNNESGINNMHEKDQSLQRFGGFQGMCDLIEKDIDCIDLSYNQPDNLKRILNEKSEDYVSTIWIRY